MLDIYPAEQRAQAMAIFGMGVMVGPILGPTLGGYLTDVYNWRWVFYVNLPFGIVAVVGLIAVHAERRRCSRNMRFDWTGFAVLALGIGALQMMLDRGQSEDWFNSHADHHRGGAGGARHLSVPGAHVHRRAAVHSAGAVPATATSSWRRC